MKKVKIYIHTIYFENVYFEGEMNIFWKYINKLIQKSQQNWLVNLLIIGFSHRIEIESNTSMSRTKLH